MARHTLPDSIERPAPPAGRTRPLAVSLLSSLRPAQWTKNLIIFAGLIFGQRLLDPHRVLHVGRRLRDLLRAVGRRLPDQRRRRSRRRPPASGEAHRPIASGALPVPAALGAAAVLGGGARWPRRSWLRPSVRRSLAAAISCSSALYSGPLKHVVIIDVLTIAIGFVLRAAARRRGDRRGVQPLAALLTMLLALFLALSKRRHELVLLADGATRPPPDPGGIQPVPARPDDRRGHGVDAAGLRVLHDQPGDRQQVRHRSAGLTVAVSALRDLPVPLSGAPEGGRREPVGHAPDDRPLLVCVALWGAGGDRRSSTVPCAVERQHPWPRSQSRHPPHVAGHGAARTITTLMNLAGYQDVIAKDADTALKVNISWHFFFPAARPRRGSSKA